MRLRKPSDGNVILRLSGIWPEPYGREFFLSSAEWLRTDDPGEVMVMLDGDTLIGVTGWYPVLPGIAALRWHGILPDHRGQGHGATMLDMILTRLAVHYGIHTVYELSDTQAACDFFCAHGFTPKRFRNPDTKQQLLTLMGNFKFILRRDITALRKTGASHETSSHC